MSDELSRFKVPHVRAASFVDEQVDQFDAFSITWNSNEAIHLTFGRSTLLLKNSDLVTYKDGPANYESGDVDLVRLDLGAFTIPLEVAEKLASTLTEMVSAARLRAGKDE